MMLGRPAADRDDAVPEQPEQAAEIERDRSERQANALHDPALVASAPGDPGGDHARAGPGRRTGARGRNPQQAYFNSATAPLQIRSGTAPGGPSDLLATRGPFWPVLRTYRRLPIGRVPAERPASTVEACTPDRTLAVSPFPGDADRPTPTRAAPGAGQSATQRRDVYLAAVAALCAAPAAGAGRRDGNPVGTDGRAGLASDKEAEMSVVGAAGGRRTTRHAGLHRTRLAPGLGCPRRGPVPVTLDVAASPRWPTARRRCCSTSPALTRWCIDGEVLEGLGQGHRLVDAG